MAAQPEPDDQALVATNSRQWVERGPRLMNRIEALPVAVIARVEGCALGGGLKLAMACDLIFASSNAKFGQTETKLGLVTGWGGSYRLVRRVGLSRAKELVFAGRIIDAAEAVRLGLVEWQGTPKHSRFTSQISSAPFPRVPASPTGK